MVPRWVRDRRKGRPMRRQKHVGGIAAVIREIPFQRTTVIREPETGWEAYISGKPGIEGRNRAIADEAFRRLEKFLKSLDDDSEEES